MAFSQNCRTICRTLTWTIRFRSPFHAIGRWARRQSRLPQRTAALQISWQRGDCKDRSWPFLAGQPGHQDGHLGEDQQTRHPHGTKAKMDKHVQQPKRIGMMRLDWRGELPIRCCRRSRRPTATARDGLRFQGSTPNSARQESGSLSHVAGHGLLEPKSVACRLAALPLLDRRDGWWRTLVRSRKSSGQPVERPWRSGPKRAAIAPISIHKERATTRTGPFQRAR
jgi:hypothetical protein